MSNPPMNTDFPTEYQHNTSIFRRILDLYATWFLHDYSLKFYMNPLKKIKYNGVSVSEANESAFSKNEMAKYKIDC